MATTNEMICDLKNALGDFQNFVNMGYSSSELPSSGSIKIAMEAMTRNILLLEYMEKSKKEKLGVVSFVG